MENKKIKSTVLSSSPTSNDDLIEKLVTVQQQLVVTVENLTESFFDSTIDRAIEKVRIGFKLVHDRVHSLVKDFVQLQKEKDERIAMLECKYNETLAALTKKLKKCELLEKEKESIINQNIHHSQFSARLGAVSGQLIWKSSKYPQIVNTWLTDHLSIVGEFLSIAIITIRSFVETFQPSFPPMNADETQFVITVLGIVTNISATSGGRKFIIDYQKGEKLIADLVGFLPLMIGATGLAVKKLILKILFNVSMNREGLSFLFQLNIEKSIVHCFEGSTPTEILTLVLQLLQSLTYNLTDPRILQRFLETLPVDKIQELSTSEDQDIRSNVAIQAQGVLINLNDDQADADTLSNDSKQADEF